MGNREKGGIWILRWLSLRHVRHVHSFIRAKWACVYVCVCRGKLRKSCVCFGNIGGINEVMTTRLWFSHSCFFFFLPRIAPDSIIVWVRWFYSFESRQESRGHICLRLPLVGVDRWVTWCESLCRDSHWGFQTLLPYLVILTFGGMGHMLSYEYCAYAMTHKDLPFVA